MGPKSCSSSPAASLRLCTQRNPSAQGHPAVKMAKLKHFCRPPAHSLFFPCVTATSLPIGYSLFCSPHTELQILYGLSCESSTLHRNPCLLLGGLFPTSLCSSDGRQLCIPNCWVPVCLTGESFCDCTVWAACL